jgi:(E)-4-hydroxy-3-methylbut-2-enyl-diphosphate synthase
MSVYCSSRFSTIRRSSREVFIGNLGVGADHPIRIQSMTTTNTQDVDATVKQAIALAESGCEIVRIAAPNKTAARALKDIHAQFRAAGFDTPLVADIHFLPSAAMEAVEHVEKVRINPGNYADNKKFSTREYTDDQYEEELQRLYEGFSPLVLRSKELGRAMRIGTNHGSLSDRIMNRYGDTPLGMVESALEFLRIAESHSYQDIILSMKASNPKVMIEAYRLLVDRMDGEDMSYPLHLGVTEAGDGEDGRIKSAIGIGSLLMDGLGDTIRVSLTEDPVFEIPVAQALANKVMANWSESNQESEKPDSIDPYHFQRRSIATFEVASEKRVGTEEPPTVITRTPFELSQFEALENALSGNPYRRPLPHRSFR